MTGLLDPPVDVSLQQLPHPVSVGADHHRAPDRAAVHQLGLEDELVVPGGEVFALRGYSAFIVRHTGEDRGSCLPARPGFRLLRLVRALSAARISRIMREITAL